MWAQNQIKMKWKVGTIFSHPTRAGGVVQLIVKKRYDFCIGCIFNGCDVEGRSCCSNSYIERDSSKIPHCNNVIFELAPFFSRRQDEDI